MIPIYPISNNELAWCPKIQPYKVGEIFVQNNPIEAGEDLIVDSWIKENSEYQEEDIIEVHNSKWHANFLIDNISITQTKNIIDKPYLMNDDNDLLLKNLRMDTYLLIGDMILL